MVGEADHFKSLKLAIGERDAAMSRNDRAGIESKGQQSEIASLKLELEACKQSAQQQSAAVTVTAAQLEKTTLEAASTKAELQSTNIELEACRREIQQRTSTNTSLMTQLENLVKELASSKAEIHSLKVQAEASKRDLDLTKQTIDNSTQEAARNISSLHEARSALETTRLEVQRANGKISQLEGERDALRAANAHDRDHHIRTMHSMNEEASSARRKMEERITALSNDLKMAHRALEEANRRFQNAATPAGILRNLF